MTNVALPGPPNLHHHHLRSALEFAVGIAEAGQKLKPPLPIPGDIKPFLRTRRLPAAALGRVRRIVEGDVDFRRRVAAGAVPELVDAIGIEWLRREEGWEERVATLLEEAETAASSQAAERDARREEKRRIAAEEAAARTRAELVALVDRVAELEEEVASYRHRLEDGADDNATLRQELLEARQEARHTRDRAEADRQRLAAVESERDVQVRRATHAERQRDELLAARAELAGITVAPRQIAELSELAASARSLASRLGSLVDVGPKRVAIDVPSEFAKQPRRSAEYLLSRPGVLVLIDGYNVAKLAWPDLSLEEQRERTLDAVDAVARRFTTEIAVIFDGATVVGAHASRRRLARVRYSPAGVSADDVIRSEVGALEPHRPVMVVTNDTAIRRDVLAAGANVVASETFVDVALG
ncbi:MAG: NYN domain-containing protein [Acidimicrobiales bacterium]